jgi:hypothetical protein
VGTVVLLGGNSEGHGSGGLPPPGSEGPTSGNPTASSMRLKTVS